MTAKRSIGHRSPAIAAAFGLVAALVLAGCSSSGTSSTSPSSTGNGASSGASPSSGGNGSFFTKVEAADSRILAGTKTYSAARSALPSKIRSNGSLDIGTQTSAPENFDAPGGSKLIGDEVTLAKALAKTLGLKPNFHVVQFDELIPGLTSQRFDMTIGAMNDTKERQGKINFLDYFNAGVGIVVKKGNPKNVTGVKSFCGLSVNVQLGTTQEALAKKQSKQCKAAGKKGVSIVYAKNNAQQQAELTSGRVDIYLADSPTAAYVVKQHPAQFEQAAASTPIDAAPYGIGFTKSSGKLMKAMQKALTHLISTGTYGKILKAWGVQSGAVKSAKINSATS